MAISQTEFVTKQDLQVFGDVLAKELVVRISDEVTRRVIDDIGSVFNSFAQVVHDELVAIKKDIQGLKADVKDLKKDVSLLKKDVSALKKDVLSLKKDVIILKKDVSVLKKDVNKLKKDVASLKISFTGFKENEDARTGRVYRWIDQLARHTGVNLDY